MNHLRDNFRLHCLGMRRLVTKLASVLAIMGTTFFLTGTTMAQGQCGRVVWSQISYTIYGCPATYLPYLIEEAIEQVGVPPVCVLMPSTGAPYCYWQCTVTFYSNCDPATPIGETGGGGGCSGGCCGGSGGAGGSASGGGSGSGPAAPKGGAACGSPINLANGNTYIQQTDIAIPGLGGGLTLARMWNSMWPPSQSAYASGLFGLNWRSTYEERMFMGSDGTAKYSRADGSFWSFAPTANGFQLVAPANANITLAFSSANWTITMGNGEKRLFDPNSGSLTAIIDRNGNTTQISYDTLNRLITVTDPASRHLYFSYDDTATSYGSQVVTVSSDVGLSLSYSYDSQGRLVTVTKPDNTTISFTYNQQSLITAVTDSQGQLLESHTYDSYGRGLTSSRANGVEAVTIAYPQ